MKCRILFAACLLILPSCKEGGSRAAVYKVVLVSQAPARLGGKISEEVVADTAVSDEMAYRHAYRRFFSTVYHGGKPGVEVLQVPIGYRIYDPAGKEIKKELSDQEKREIEAEVRGE